MVASGHRTSTYALIRKDEILGYLSIHQDGHKNLMIDELAVAEEHQGKGFSGILMRFADTLARQSDCKHVRLQAVSDKVSFYEKFGYKRISENPIRLDKEQYFAMDRALLHGLPQVPDVDLLDI